MGAYASSVASSSSSTEDAVTNPVYFPPGSTWADSTEGRTVASVEEYALECIKIAEAFGAAQNVLPPLRLDEESELKLQLHAESQDKLLAYSSGLVQYLLRREGSRDDSTALKRAAHLLVKGVKAREEQEADQPHSTNTHGGMDDFYELLANLLERYVQHVRARRGQLDTFDPENLTTEDGIQHEVIAMWRMGDDPHALLPGQERIPMPLPLEVVEGLTSLGFTGPRAPREQHYKHAITAGGSLSSMYAYGRFLNEACKDGIAVENVSMLASTRPSNEKIDANVMNWGPAESPAALRIFQCPRALSSEEGDTEQDLADKVLKHFADLQGLEGPCPWRSGRVVATLAPGSEELPDAKFRQVLFEETLQRWLDETELEAPGKILIVAMQPMLRRFQLQASKLLMRYVANDPRRRGLEVEVVGPSLPERAFQNEAKRANILLNEVAAFVQEHRQLPRE